MPRALAVVHHPDRRTDVAMPYAPAIVVRRGHLVFVSGLTAAPVYHSHPHRDEEFDLPPSMREQAVRLMENLRATLAAAGCGLADVVSATRYLTDVAEQDDLNRVWAAYLGDHLPTTTTVEVSRLATHARCKVEISVIAVADDAPAPARRARAAPRAPAPGPRRRPPLPPLMAIGWIGLGAMGSRMARRLLAAGYPVTGWNRTPGKARELVAAGLAPAASPRAVAEAADVIFTMVTDDAALRSVAGGEDGLLAGLRRGATLVEMSTVSPAVTREIGAAVAARGAHMLDAPVSGSTITVEQGQASVQVGGDAAALERVRPYLDAIGPGGVTHVGPLGLAKTMKIATNLCLPIQMLAFCEAVLLAEQSGIAREVAVQALMRSVAASPMVRYRGPFVLGAMPADAWFSVPMIQKDVQLALDQGRAAGVPLPATALVQEWLTMARGLGLGHYDFAVLFDVLAWMAGARPSLKPEGR